ncbi:hypothetical protein PPTG_23923 [Phytophthora nicotianae INRA-310]|uniref:Uncharacterized protein n=1 Tax=Phytophthora nicotianae (strain INRA-310) TaxID=761204 RepID=W2PR35_PHYN3|nr:hypothetical protein PPTG_23923 [Phytophthora nicotianae INRA-310]ETN02455.1 hypothetical protein PPTG_23923 [Phytophthora nicotianae INRA-310]
MRAFTQKTNKWQQKVKTGNKKSKRATEKLPGVSPSVITRRSAPPSYLRPGFVAPLRIITPKVVWSIAFGDTATSASQTLTTALPVVAVVDSVDNRVSAPPTLRTFLRNVP